VAGDEFTQVVLNPSSGGAEDSQCDAPDGVIDGDVSCVGVFDIFVVHGVLDSVLNIVYLFLFFRLPARGGSQNRKYI
jgi:hypothetical protein